jgi:hypothetical protein
MAVNIEITIFCVWQYMIRWIGGGYKVESVCSLEMLLPIYQST